MNIYADLWKYVAHIFLEWEMFQTFCVQQLFSPKIVPVMR